MNPLSRRPFLQFAGAVLASLGLHQIDRYGKVLAQPTSRKLALLVGINAYPEQGLALAGCVNDVELQKHLLIHRFGFNPSDILTITDAQATRQGILDAFEEHLIEQAKPGDVVVFHYSGHGSIASDPDSIITNRADPLFGTNGTFVPVDASLPPGYPEQGGEVKDIMGHTLFLLMSALQTENVTAVLDSCFSGGATREFRARSRNGGKNLQLSQAEKDYQARWLSRLNLSREEFIEGYRRGVAKGVLLAAAQPYQTAADAQLNGFTAGIFTYLLTQYLWQEDGTPESAIARILPQIPKEYRQSPKFEVKPDSDYNTQPLYFVNPSNPVADAVVTEANQTQAKLWLGGIDGGILERGMVFKALSGSGQVRLTRRKGLVAEATIEKTVSPGTLLKLVH
ncbi:caspase family protein [Oscillatoria sp. FACHB-1406]|uniref:caspase family protein n=1 Tax=Oscillatoria sp. FACHB-1406 TaxID=2692846 RepID=UPI001686C9F3|nr:caspase family protein [Oscillatoria sp. FACHB-1406]MBD2578331.1 caspase family protein [Oscillatoria sp. FACHB-1406]